MAYTTPRTWVAGEYPTAAQMNANVRDNVAFLANPPACHAFHSVVQAITTGTVTTVALNSEQFDTDTMHDTVTNNSRVTFTTAGLYVVTARANFAANTTGRRFLQILQGGATNLGRVEVAPDGGGGEWDACVVTLRKFAATNFIEMQVFQSSGGNLDVSAGELSAVWVGKG